MLRVNYEQGMITTRLQRIGVMLALAGACSFGLPVLPGHADGGLLARCWPAESLLSRPEERQPVRGAPGHAVSMPKLPLPAATPVPAGERGSIRRVELPKGLKLVALTLDLCEQPGEIAGYDGPIFDYLRRNGVKATVFAGGKWLLTHGERAEQLIADPLLEIGNHGWAHRNVRGLEGQALAAEMLGPQLSYIARRAALSARQCVRDAPALMAARPAAPALYRFPYGACNAAALDTLATNGLKAIQWDVSTGDASPSQSAAAVAAAMTRGVRPGSIILAHANGRGYNTAAALAIAVPKLREQGYTFVTVSELLAAGKPVVSPTCYDSRPGDTDRYDALFRRPPVLPTVSRP